MSAAAASRAAIPLIELENISRRFVTDGGVEVQALCGVSLTIHPGEFVAIVGQSGSGKTTLMNLLGCLDRPSGGVYRFAGRDIEAFDADDLAWLRREAFGFVFQSYNLLPAATAEENVELPGVYAGLSAEQRRIRAQGLLVSLGLGDRLDHRPSQLSGGQQQRVSIARALMNGGAVILADEPTGALDTASGLEVMQLLKELARAGHTVIIITHDPEVAKNADRVIEFRDGRVVRDSGRLGSAASADGSSRLRELFLSRRSASALAGLGESLRIALRSLKDNLFRTVLTLLGIVIGVASVVAMLAIGEGARQDVVARISAIGTNLLTLEPARAPGGRRNLPSTLTFEDADAILDGVPNVLASAPELQGNETVRYGRQDRRTTVLATAESMPVIQNWPLARGVFFTREDSEQYAAVVVLGATLAEALFDEDEDPLGEYVLIRNAPFQVIGVLTRKGSSGFGGRDRDNTVIVPYHTGALRLFGEWNARSIAVAVDDVSLMEQTERHVAELLTARHGEEDFRITNSEELLQTVSASQRTFTILLGSIGAIALLVGGIGVMNIMLVSVTERTREIGIRMATGARRKDIQSQFLAEAIMVSCIGGLLGLLLGVGAGFALQSFDVNIAFAAAPMIIAFSCAAATGLVFGFAPARKAAALDPVAALANE